MGGIVSKFRTSPLRISLLYNQMLNTKSVADFKMVEDNITWKERLHMGYNHEVWNTICLYKFMIDFKTNICYNEASVLSEYRDIEFEVIEGFKLYKEWAVLPMLFLCRAGKKKYNRLWDNLMNKGPSEFQKEASKYLNPMNIV